jgi:hypothetical protein
MRWDTYFIGTMVKCLKYKVKDRREGECNSMKDFCINIERTRDLNVKD